MSEELELKPPTPSIKALRRSDPTTRLAWGGFRRWKAPIWLTLCAPLFVVLTWLPIAVAIDARTDMGKQKPRIHIIQDMDNQPRTNPQAASALFNDGRAYRGRIPGTVARGEFNADHAFIDGFTQAIGEDGKVTTNFVTGYPESIQAKLNDPVQARAFIGLGQQKFTLNCALCHGADGHGLGPIAVRANEVGAKLTGWTDPSNLTDEVRRGRPNGHLYNTVNNGIRKMQGYGPVLSPEERWAVVAYVRTLQLAEHAPKSVLTPEQLKTLQ